ncbi:MAG: TetR/AcrR family transcriptional regulator [Hahellaceae bacterium]|jgi:AcrR family transcriptional regulator|nr:TetR/AcrR family transcriptional regulator [Hahellaceae bacterium]
MEHHETSVISIDQMPRKEREFLRRQQDILTAARNLFGGADWQQVTVEQIAREAEIGKGTVYKHFASKEAIYANIAISFHESLLTKFQQISLTQPIDRVMHAIIRTSFDLFLAHPAEARISHYCKRGDFLEGLDSQLQAQFLNLEGRFNEYIYQVLDIGIDQGVIPKRPHDQLVVGLEATFDGALFMIWNGQVNHLSHMQQNEFVDVISEFMLAGLLGLPKHLSENRT